MPQTSERKARKTKLFNKLLIADFAADLKAMARQHLQGHFPDDAISDSDAFIWYFDSLRRLPAPRPRQVRIADGFHCPTEVLAGWNALQAKIAKGEDISPHLSTGHRSVKNRDGLLNEWNVHHLHLGTAPHPKYARFVERSKQIVLAVITDDDFYALTVLPEHGGWEDIEIIESIRRNWPDLIQHYKIAGVKAETLTPRQRKSLRGANVLTLTEAGDGTIYAPLGGGVSVAGASITALKRAIKALENVKRLQRAVQEQIGKFMDPLRAHGYSGEQDLKATLFGVRPEGYEILFPEYGMRVPVRWAHDP